MIVVNFKTYPNGIGRKAVELSQEILRHSRAKTFLAPPFLELPVVKRSVGKKAMVLSQHVDGVEEGHHTGHVVVESLAEWGIDGSIVNHSERPLPWKERKKALERLKEKGLISILCLPTYREVKRGSKLNPDFIAIEPPELIAGKVSVSEAEPWIIEKAVERTDIPVLCGAGIHSARDVEKALELGAIGILVASSVMKAKNPGKVVERLTKPMKSL